MFFHPTCHPRLRAALCVTQSCHGDTAPEGHRARGPAPCDGTAASSVPAADSHRVFSDTRHLTRGRREDAGVTWKTPRDTPDVPVY